MLFRRTSWGKVGRPARLDQLDGRMTLPSVKKIRYQRSRTRRMRVSKTGAPPCPPLVEGSSSTRVTTRSVSKLSPIKENSTSPSPVATNSPVQLSPHRSPPTNMDVSDISSDESDQERTMNNVEDPQRIRKVTMDSQPVPGVPERDDEGNFVRKRRKARTARPRPGPDPWITPSEDVGGVIADSPSRRYPNRVNARAAIPVSISGANTGAGWNLEDRARENFRSFFRTPSPRREVTRSASHCSSLTDVYDISEDDDQRRQRQQLSTSRPTSGSRGQMKRRDYLRSDGQAILDFILKKRWLPFVAGNLKWQYIERERLLEKELGFRTWQSLRNHWSKTIAPDLDQPRGPKRYRISEENLKVYKESKKRRTGGGRRRK